MEIQYDIKLKCGCVITKIPKIYCNPEEPDIILDEYGYSKKCVVEENANDEEIEMPKLRKGKRVLGKIIKVE